MNVEDMHSQLVSDSTVSRQRPPSPAADDLTEKAAMISIHDTQGKMANIHANSCLQMSTVYGILRWLFIVFLCKFVSRILAVTYIGEQWYLVLWWELDQRLRRYRDAS